MHTRHKTVPRAERRLICGKNPLQQQHRLANAQLAQLQGLIHGRDGKTVHIRERRQNVRHAMPVGIGFYHRNQLRRACLLAQHPHIVAQRRHINHLHQRTHCLPPHMKTAANYSGCGFHYDDLRRRRLRQKSGRAMARTMANGLMMMPKTTAPLRSLSLFLM